MSNYPRNEFHKKKNKNKKSECIIPPLISQENRDLKWARLEKFSDIYFIENVLLISSKLVWNYINMINREFFQ